MNRPSRHGKALLVGLVASVALAIVLPSAALATKRAPRLAASVGPDTAVQGKTVTAYATVTDSAGHNVGSDRVTFSWLGARKPLVTYATTNRSGRATSAVTVGWSAWQTVTVVMSAKVGKLPVSGKASFMALPDPTSSHPVTVKIGAALPLSQGATVIGQGMLRGVQLAAAQADASPTVQGLCLRFAVAPADDKGDPATAVKVASALAADSTVLGVAGHLNSGCSIPASKVYSAARIAMVTGGSTNPVLTQMGLHNVFRAIYSDSFQGPGAATFARGLGFAKAVVVDDSTSYGETILADAFAASFASQGGTLALRIHTLDRDTVFAAVISKIKALHPDVVYYGGIYNAGALFSSQLHAAGVTAPVIGGDGLYDPAYISRGGATSVAGDYAASVGYPASALPDGGAFASAFASAYPGVSMTDYDAYSYDSARVLIGAIMRQTAGGRVTAWLGAPTGRRGIISQVQATDMQGATGRIRFGATGERLDPRISIFRVVAGAWVYQTTP